MKTKHMARELSAAFSAPRLKARALSLTDSRPILLYSNGQIAALEYGTVYNGECQVLVCGRPGESCSFAPIAQFCMGREISTKEMNKFPASNKIGQEHLDRANADMRGCGLIPYNGEE